MTSPPPSSSDAVPEHVSTKDDTAWGLSLVFQDVDTEKRFQEEVMESRLRHEKNVHDFAAIGLTLWTLTQWNNLSPRGHLYMLFCSLGIAPTCAFLIRRRRAVYTKWRVFLVALVHVSMATSHLFLLESTNPPAPSWCKILGRLVMKSSASPMLFLSLHLALPLKKQFALHVLVSPILLVWANKFHTLCLTSPEMELTSVFESIGRMLDRCLFFFLNSPIPEESFTAIMVVNWVVITVGVLVPMAIAYYIEIFRRWSFVSCKCPSFNCWALNMSVSSSLEIGVWYLIAGTQATWITCRLLSDRLVV